MENIKNVISEIIAENSTAFPGMMIIGLKDYRDVVNEARQLDTELTELRYQMKIDRLTSEIKMLKEENSDYLCKNYRLESELKELKQNAQA
jgi:predicted RNase H-like nuclease (RuvC/YqgF family)